MTQTNPNKPANPTVRLAKMGMLVAISVVLVYLIHFPIFPAVAFLEYDPADIPILIGTFAFGPLAGVLLTVVTSIIQGVTVSALVAMMCIRIPYTPLAALTVTP